MEHEYVVWFRDPSLPPDDEDYEWPATFVVVAAADTAAKAWGDTLASDYAGRTGQIVLCSKIVPDGTLDVELPRVDDQERVSDIKIGW